MIDVPPTEALRRRSPELLRVALLRLVVDRAAVWQLDSRELMLALAPYHHCAGQLEVAQAALFADVAAAGPVELAATVSTFGQRSDITPTAFGFVVEALEDGPAYVWPDPDADAIERLLRDVEP